MYVSSSDAQATAMVVAVSRPPLPCAMFWVGGVSDEGEAKGKGVSTKIYFGGQPLLSMKKSSPLHPPTQHGICILNDAETRICTLLILRERATKLVRAARSLLSNARRRAALPSCMADPACAGASSRLLPPTSRPCCTGLKACPAWPGEPWLAANTTPAHRATAKALAAHWLQPFQRAGITRRALVPHDKNRRAEDMLCPVLQVVNNRIYVVGHPEMRQLEMQLHRCDASPIPGDTNGNYCASAACRRRLPRVWERHRFQVALRLLHIATERARLPDFELRLCLDDTCAATATFTGPHLECHSYSRRCAGATACGKSLHDRGRSSRWRRVSMRLRCPLCNGTPTSSAIPTSRFGTASGAAGRVWPRRRSHHGNGPADAALLHSEVLPISSTLTTTGGRPQAKSGALASRPPTTM